MMRPGPRNLITDIPGLLVGNAEDHAVKTGATVLLSDTPFTAAVHVMGGAPGTRETDLLAPDKTVQQIDALVLSGGSAFGLDAASGVADGLRAAGRGFDVGGQRVPIVPGAIVFDLLNGGDKDWRDNPYKRLGRAALEAATARISSPRPVRSGPSSAASAPRPSTTPPPCPASRATRARRRPSPSSQPMPR